MAVLAKAIEQWPVDRPKLWPGNPRRGDIELIKESIEVNGFYQPIIIQASSGYVIAGNHRLLAAREIKMPEVPVVVLDVDDDRARRMVLVDNRSGDKATYDTDDLVDLLGLFDVDDLDGTGWTKEEIEALITPVDFEPEEPEPVGHIEYSVIVECDSEAQQARLLAQFEREGLNARPVVA